MTPTTKDRRMTDPILLQRQLIAATERADELEAQLERIASKVVTITVHDGADVELRLARIEAVLEARGEVLPALTFNPLRQAMRGRVDAQGDR